MCREPLKEEDFIYRTILSSYKTLDELKQTLINNKHNIIYKHAIYLKEK